MAAGRPYLTFWLLAYMAITTAYSFRLKAVMVGDAIVLASLYTIRIWIGAVAIGVALSFWLLLFSVLLFLSLAYLEATSRCARSAQRQSTSATRR